MIILLYTVYVFVCLVLIGVVLLQSGKGADLATAFGAGGSQAAIGARGAATFLSKLTTWSAIAFMVLSLLLAVLKSRDVSVLDQAAAPAAAAPAAAAPAAPAGTATAPPAPDTTAPVPPAGTSPDAPGAAPVLPESPVPPSPADASGSPPPDAAAPATGAPPAAGADGGAPPQP
jgi:preprotein translocase subunit SecG